MILSDLRLWRNLRKMVLGRQRWSPESEFAYYAVSAQAVDEALRRQREFDASGYLVGLRIAHAMGLDGADSVRGRDVLDIGAGECLLGGALRVCCRARSVWAVDAVPRQIWAAASYHEAEADAYRFVVAGADDLPFGDATFDVVTANLVMHHIEPLSPVVREAARVLRPGGVFVCSEPTPLLGAFVHERGSDNEAPVPPGRLVRELRAAGFEVSWKYSWVRFDTSALGPLSPGYTIKARMPGARVDAKEPPGPSRPLSESGLPHLLLDTACRHLAQARQQCAEIARHRGA